MKIVALAEYDDNDMNDLVERDATAEFAWNSIKNFRILTEYSI